MQDKVPQEPLRILHLEDEPKDALLVQATLEGDGLVCELESVKTRAEFLAALERGGCDLILSDFAIPAFDGIAALEIARKAAPDVPFIFVSGTLGEEAAIAAVRSGATDYVLKQRLSRLAPAVRRAASEAEERRRLKLVEQALRESEQRFHQAQKMEAVGRLAAGVAHDFNNMLTAILGYAALAKMKLGLAHPVLSDLDEIRKAGERSAGLTRQLLAFSRQQALQPRALDLNAVITDLEKMLRRLIGEDVDLVTRPRKDLGRIMADPGQIEQVLLNLVVNARDAMPQGGRLTIETSEILLDETTARGRLDMGAGACVMLAVSDDGVGMSAEVKARIFEPFYTTREHGKGTGLGLSTVYGIVRQSAGSIEVYSEPGQGTTFKLYFPRVEAEVSPDVSHPREDVPATGSETILLVEDEDSVRAVTRQTLTLYGYRVREACNGHEAMRILEETREIIDLLITDVLMPGMTVSELMARAAALRPEMRVLCVSGYAEQAILHRALVVEKTPFLQKPFAPETLARKVRDVLDEDRRQAA